MCWSRARRSSSVAVVDPTVTVEGGVLSGEREGDVLHYRGIPYAKARRFGPPEPVQSWHGIRDASFPGPICPQPVSRLAPVMGETPHMPQDEDCLSLNVAIPIAVSARPRAVMVWLHGGAYVVGAGSYEWYREDRLVTEGDVVVVTVNYRLGVFGYLRMPGVSDGNAGLEDQIAALRWVAKNIAAFGGDPGLVTVFGESAGGHSIAALMATPQARGLLRRAILQSAQLGLGFMKAASAERTAQIVQSFLGGADVRTAPVERLLAAQQQAMTKSEGPAGLNSAPILGPVAGVPPLPVPAQTDPAKAIVHDGVDVLIGTTREEMRAFFDTNTRLVRFRRLPAIGEPAFTRLVRTVTERVFIAPARKLADALVSSGARVYRYSFEWTPPRGGFGACHTIDLPFVWGGEAWNGSPMLGDARPEDVDALGRRVRRAWTAFARHGDPNAPGSGNAKSEPAWERHTAGAEVGRRFS